LRRPLLSPGIPRRGALRPLIARSDRPSAGMWPQRNRHTWPRDGPRTDLLPPRLEATYPCGWGWPSLSTEYNNMNKKMSLIAAGVIAAAVVPAAASAQSTSGVTGYGSLGYSYHDMD